MSTQTKIPHTANFLQTFHNGGAGLPAEIDDNAAEYALAASDLLDMVPVEAPAYSLSPAQVKLISSLVLEINALDSATGEVAASYTARMDREGAWTRENTRRWIGNMIKKSRELNAKRPMLNGEATNHLPVPDGRYAVTVDGALRFYKVKNGHKAGFVFLDVQASDDWHPIRNLGKIREVLALVAADTKGAMIRYGQELGECGRCGRTLTSEYRKLGIGPVCQSK